ncbi:hypothetical protein FOA43_001669 [Brettanomyces nanus]|uniref:Uncharacterized protein n=1 Tax=Eeniella nana TaxID=13502 RepID=A0A875S2P2_EENNA|nr:uncharacterized protein FOA43_001669 [Brettanomyces nanus]QPG74342.1 hypothetical protein FOA43_001669 [Brettanomyces nanus]
MASKRFYSSEMETLYNHLARGQEDFISTSNDRDLPVLNKLKENISRIRSSYWRIDESSNNDELGLSKLSSLSVDEDLVAIGSTSDCENLRIYNLDTEKILMTHLSTISLPDIHSIQWLYDPTKRDDTPKTLPEDDSIRFLLTGHTDGVVNLTMIPIGDNAGIPNAQIIKRFNHEKHVSENDSCLRIANNGKPTNIVYQLEVTPKHWKTCNKNSLISLYKENMFLWDTTRSRFPILKNKTKGVSAFDANEKTDGLMALAGSFGVSLLDMRTCDNSGFSSSFFIPDKMNKECLTANWCKENSNYLCSANLDDQLTIWDIRNLKPLAVLESHSDNITSIQWNKFASIYSASNDGTLIYWDLSILNFSQDVHIPDGSQTVRCTTKNSLNLDVTSNEIGTCIPVSNNSIVAMKSVGDNMTLTMDESFLGLHTRIENVGDRRSSSSMATLVGEEIPDYKLAKAPRLPRLQKPKIHHRRRSSRHDLSPSTLVNKDDVGDKYFYL